MGWQDAPTVAAAPKWASAPAVAQAEPPGRMEALARGAGQGVTLGFGDELAGAAGALGDLAHPVDAYTRGRDESRAANKAAKDAHPGYFVGGQIGGSLPLAFLGGGIGVAKHAPLLAKALQLARVGAGFGAAQGLGDAEGDAATQAGDMLKGGAIGGVLGGALPIAGETIALPVAQKLRDVATNAGRRVLSRTVQSLSNKEALPDAAVHEAMRQGAFGPLKDVKYANEVLNNAREAVGDQYAQILDTLAAKGVTGPDAQALAQKLAAEAQQISANTLGSPRPGIFQGVADELATKPVDAAGNLGLAQSESMKRELQHLARAQYDKLKAMQTPAGDAQESIASRMRQAIEDAVDAQRAKAPAEAAAFQPVKEQLSNIIAASNSARGGANRALKNAAISLPDVVMAASGQPHALAKAALVHALKTRGASTTAWALPGVADALEGAVSSPQSLLAQYLRRAALPIASEQVAP